MKTQRILFASLLFVSALAVAGTASAQDPLAVAPGMYKLLFENDHVRVMQVSFKPGDKIAKHSHPDHFVLVETPGTLTVSKPDGSNTELDLTADQVVWIPAETHWAQNTGKTDIKLTVTELKTGSKPMTVSSAK